MNAHIFREYDIRGIISHDITIDEFKPLAKSIFTYLLQCNPHMQTMVIGRDGRTHSPEIMHVITQVIIGLGCNVIDIGLCPTPLLYFAMETLNADAGLMITASHNPKEYNGIKTCLEKKSLWGEAIQEIKHIFESKKYLDYPADNTGTIQAYDIISHYVSWIAKQFPTLKNFSVPILIDCGNGTAGPVLKRIIETLQWTNTELMFAQVDGNFPHHGPDPTNKKNMQTLSDHLQQENCFELGIGFDGDCDRMSALLPDGYLMQSDELLSIFAHEVLENHPGSSIVCDIKSSASLLERLKTLNAQSHLSPCGHAIIKETMKKHSAKLGGELSGHFFFADEYFGYDDGIYAMMRLLRLLQKSNESLTAHAHKLPKKVSSPEIRLYCPDDKKHAVVAHVHSQLEKSNYPLITVDGVRAQLDHGWGLVRVSNTQPAVSMRFEGDTAQDLEKIKLYFSLLLSPFFEKQKLLKNLELNI